MTLPARGEANAPANDGFVPLAVPQVGEREAQNLRTCIDTGWVSSVGGFVDQFERDVADWAGARHGVAVASGTAALHLALKVSGVLRDDEVIVPSLTFIAPANAVTYVGAVPVFVDVDPKFWQIDPVRVQEFLETRCEVRDDGCYNRATSRRVSAILAVDALGHPADLDAIAELAGRWGLTLVEDAAEALGARYKNRVVGAGPHTACFSFNGNKIITAGGGGMIMTDDDALAERARYLSTQAKDDPVAYVHREIGFNYRLTNVHAAIGCAQMERLEEFVERKRALRRAYDEAFAELPGVRLQDEAEWATSTSWLYTTRIHPEQCGITGEDLVPWFAERGIQVRPLWQPLHRSEAHAGSPRQPCPVAEAVAADALSLPSSTGLGDREQQIVIDAVRTLVGRGGS